MAIGRYVANAGTITYPPRSTLGPRVQLGCQLVVVHSGFVRVTVDDRDREIPPSHVGLLLPGATEYFVFGHGYETTRHSWIALPPDLLARELLHALTQAPPCLPLTPAMAACIDAGRAVAQVDDPEQPAVVTAVARAAMLLYVSEARHTIEKGAQEHPVVTQARTIVRQRAREGITVKDLAKEVGVSPEHLVRLFRRDAGTTPGAALRAERLSCALQLLTQSGLSVTEVAHRAGFAGSQHLARSLRLATGLTASELRRRSWSASFADNRAAQVARLAGD